MADNTFGTARYLGAIGGDSAKTFQIRGSLTSQDTVDVYRYTIRPGATISRASASGQVRGGSFKISTLYRDPLTNTLVKALPTQTVKAGEYSERANLSLKNPSSSVVTAYIKLSNPTQDLQYRFSVTYEP